MLLCTLYLSACSTTTNTNTFTPLSAEADQVVVYIYRPSVMSNAIYSPDLYVNDEFKLSIKNGKNTRLLLAPGEHKFKLEPDKNYAETTHLLLNLHTGKIYFFRVDTSLELNSATNFEPYERSFNLIKVDEKLAGQQIAECCITKNNKATEKSETKSVNKKMNESFSVDKTQNPFSH